MKYPHFTGGTYESQSPIAAGMRTYNYYWERIEDPGGTARYALYPTPGFELLANTTSTDGRGHIFIGGREFAVVGASLFELDSDAAGTFLGTVAMDSNPATLSSNGDNELFITSGGNGYILNLTTSALTQVAALNGKATMGDAIDGYFLALDANTGTLYSSDLLDGLTWSTTIMSAQRNSAPDPWIAMKVLGPYIWLLGSQTSEVWYDAGDSPFPFAKVPQSLVQWGVAAPFSAAVCAGSLIWLGASKDGHGFVLRADGLSPENIATYPVQYAIGNYGTVSDARADGFRFAGHSFYALSFPTANASWLFDLEMSMWSRLGTWSPSTSSDFSVWRPRHHAFAFGEHRWLHGTGTGVYRMVANGGHDVDGLLIRRVRRAPALQKENRRITYPGLELLLEPGLGTSGQAENPQVMMRFSNDGGKTWSSEIMASAGKEGEFHKRVRWSRLGTGRQRVFEVAMSDPIAWRIVDAYLTPDPQPEAA